MKTIIDIILEPLFYCINLRIRNGEFPTYNFQEYCQYLKKVLKILKVTILFHKYQ